MHKKLVAGNFKMNGSLASQETIKAIAEFSQQHSQSVDTVLCVPFVYIHHFANLSLVKIGGQNCHAEQSGAFTGEISANMLYDVKATSVIVGHSERRTDFNETNELVRAKAVAALKAQLFPIICVGETKEQYQEKISARVVTEQIKLSVPENDGNIAIGYEPIWAIGTGLTPELNEIEDIHGTIRTTLTDLFGQDAAQKTRILYGGSVKPDNAHHIAKLNNIDGALVGGASLKANEFNAIIAAFS